MTVGGLRELLATSMDLANSDIERILAHVTGRSAAWLRAYAETELPPEAVSQAREFGARRAAGEPVAYILGSVGFYGHTFAVDARVLVPRPETEHLVDEALSFIADIPHARVLDVGTGSGAIACSIAAAHGGAHVDAIDVSPDALLVATANARGLGVETRVRFAHGDVTSPAVHPPYDAIVANLPYVPTRDIACAPDPVSFEPRIALDGGADGLDLYRTLLGQAPRVLRPGGLLLMEAAPPIMAGLVELARRAFPQAEVSIGRDYGQRDRLVKVCTPG